MALLFGSLPAGAVCHDGNGEVISEKGGSGVGYAGLPAGTSRRVKTLFRVMRIDIWSDYVCPFCTIGERHLTLALENFEGRDEVEITWRSFELDPDAPKEPQGTMVQHLAAKKGVSEEAAAENIAGLEGRAKNAGLVFNWEQAIIANTRDAHRVGKFAGERGVGPAWDSALKRGFFSEGKNIASHDYLREVAKEIGLSGADVDRVLDSREFDDAVQKDIDLAHHIGIEGVPFFIFDNQVAISGAQPMEMFTEALHRTAEGK